MAMCKKLIILKFFLLFIPVFLNGQIRVRLFTSKAPESVVFAVTEGRYVISDYNNESVVVSAGEHAVLSKFNDMVAVKARNSGGLLCDSVLIKGVSGNDGFSLRIFGNNPITQFYNGDLECIPDLGTLLLINISDIEKYIAGVVKAEGGSGKNIEYFKSQAVLARTYMYRHMNRHILDRYNLCDDTHCQVFFGVTDDTMIIRSANETKGLVILDKNNFPVISAFHSNCGGETSTPENVWLFNPPYLKKVTDPYCTSSRSATWQKSIEYNEWVSYLNNMGYTGGSTNPSVFNFAQATRASDYRVGSFTIPFRLIRTDLNLRSAFFSVSVNGDSVLLKGKGYGHGVGLCQEGAMVMAAKGYNFRQIIDFYYSGVTIADIQKASTNNTK